MAGVDSAGLGEVLQNVLAGFSDAEKGRLVKVCKNLDEYPGIRLSLKRVERPCHGLTVPTSWTSSQTAMESPPYFASRYANRDQACG